MPVNNKIIPFTLKNVSISGKVIRLNDELDLILNQHHYPDVIAKIMGELLMIAAMIGSQFKDEILLTIQLQTEEKIKYIVVDYQSPNQIRGYAQFDQTIDFTHESYENIINNALLTVTIDRKLYNNQRYQGIVEVNNLSISKAMEKYFFQSEQIKTSIKLAIGKVIMQGGKEAWCGAGIMIQQLPVREEEDNWDEAQVYFSTIRDDELLDPSLALEQLLYSVYNQMEVTIYDALLIIYKCRCSREKVEQVLQSLGLEEVVSIMIDDKISVNCQFCNQTQDFSQAEIEKIFNKDLEK